MPDQKVSATTWVGLLIALFGILIVRGAVSLFYPSLTFAVTVWRESLIWLCVVLLLLIIRKGERLPLTSINIGTAPVGRSVLWAR